MKKLFMLGLVFLFFISFVTAQDVTYGYANQGTYTAGYWGANGVKNTQQAQCFNYTDDTIIYNVSTYTLSSGESEPTIGSLWVGIYNAIGDAPATTLASPNSYYVPTGNIAEATTTTYVFYSPAYLSANTRYCMVWGANSTLYGDNNKLERPAATNPTTYNNGTAYTKEDAGAWTARAWGYQFLVNGEIFIPPVATNFVSPTPTNGSTNNTFTGVIINVTSDIDNVSVYWNGTQVGNGSEKSPFQFELNSSLVPTEGTYTYYATNGVTTTGNRTWSYDTTSPDITLNNDVNNSLNYKSINNVTINFTLTDNIDLFGFQLNITDSLGTLIYSETNVTLSGPTVTVVREIDISNNASGKYNVTLVAEDSHTANFIKDYIVKKRNKKLEFNTAEGNYIQIETDSDADTETYRKYDRYEFEFKYKNDWFGNIKKTKKYYVKCDGDLRYIQDSKYQAHFVCWNGNNGNWIDFEGQTGLKSVKKKKEYLGLGNDYYEVIFENDNKEMRFNSIGGLNINQIEFSYNVSDLIINSARISPTNAFVNEDLRGYCNGTEGEDRDVAYQGIWYKNGDFFRGIKNGTFNLVEFSETSSILGFFNYNYTNILNTASKVPYKANGVFINTSVPDKCVFNQKVQLGVEVNLSCPIMTDAINYLCYNSSNELVRFTNNPCSSGADTFDQDIYIITQTEDFSSDLEVAIDILESSDTELGDEFIFSCSALVNPQTPFLNSSSLTILNVSVDDCSTNTYNIMNFFYKDIADSSLINVDNVGYDLNFLYSAGSLNLTGTETNTNNSSFCINVNQSTREFNLSVTGSMALENTNYASKPYEITIPFIASTTSPHNESIFMILLNQSSTVTLEWLALDYSAITGTLLTYECAGDGSRTLFDSSPIINGLAVLNLELINKLYSYEVVIGSETFTDADGFTKCHIEPATERTYLVDVQGIDTASTVGMYGIPCNLTRVDNTTLVNMTWGLNDNNADEIIGCMQAFRTTVTGTTKVFESCNSDGSIQAIVPLSGFDYSVQGTLFQSGFSIACSDVIEFKDSVSTPALLGLTGLASMFFLLVGLILIFSQDVREQLLATIITLLSGFVLGFFAFGWQTTSAIITFVIVIWYIGRGAKNT